MSIFFLPPDEKERKSSHAPAAFEWDPFNWKPHTRVDLKSKCDEAKVAASEQKVMLASQEKECEQKEVHFCSKTQAQRLTDS